MDIAEKRVYDDEAGATLVAVASDLGVAVASVSADIVGEFGLALRKPSNDLAVAPDGRLAVAADTGVVLAGPPDADDGPAAVGEHQTVFERPATVVSVIDDSLLVAGPGGVFREHPDTDEWVSIEPPGDVRDASGRFLATTQGVFRVDGTDCTAVGLEDATAVTAADPICAGTGTALYRLGNGWLHERDGEVTAVASAAGRSLAVVDDEPVAYDGDAWDDTKWPLDSEPVAVTLGESRYGVTGDGTLAVDAGDGWRHRNLGVRGVQACTLWRA